MNAERNPDRNEWNARGRMWALAVVLSGGLWTATAQPNLVVRVEDQVQANHAELTFAPTAVGDMVQMIVVLRNEGNQTLEFTEDSPVMLAGGFAESFEVVQPPLEAGQTLSPNGSTAFALRFRPQVRFARLFTHVYLWTNAGAAPFHLIFSGQGTGPELVVLHEGVEIPDLGVLELDPTEIGQMREVVLTIENRGEADLELPGNPTAQIFGGFDFDFAITQQPAAAVGPSASTELRFTFTPTLERVYSTRLFIDTNENSAAVNGLYDIDILAAAFAPAVAEDPNAPADDAGTPGNEDGDEDADLDSPDANDEDANGDGAAGDDDPLDGDELDDGPFDGDETEDVDDLDEEAADEGIEEDARSILPGFGLCGFGAGFASILGMVSLGGLRAAPRRFGLRQNSAR